MPVGDQQRRPDPRRARHRVEAGNRKDRLPGAADRGGMGAIPGRFPPRLRLRRSRLRIEGESDHAPLPAAPQRNVERLAEVADDGECRNGVARRANSAGADLQHPVAGRDARPRRRTACAYRPDHGRGEVAPGAPEPPARRRVTDFAVGNQRIDHPQQQVGRDGEIDAYIGVALGGEDRRHHPDQAAFRVDQRAARDTGVRRRIRLDEVLHRVEPRVRHVERRHHAARHRQPQAERIADRANRLGQARRGRDPDRREPRRHAEHGDVARRILRDQPRRKDAPVRKPDVDPSGGFDHVPGRRDVSRAEDHAAAFRRGALTPARAALGAPRPDGQNRNHRLQGVDGQRVRRGRLKARDGEQQHDRKADGGGRVRFRHYQVVLPNA